MKKFIFGVLTGWVARGVLEIVQVYYFDDEDLAGYKAEVDRIGSTLEHEFKGLLGKD